MRVIEPHHLIKSKKIKPKKKLRFGLFSVLIFLVIGVYLFSIIMTSNNELRAETIGQMAIEPEKVNVEWPKDVQSAVGAVGYGVLASNGKQDPLPIASVAKVMVALAVLKQKPLKIGDQGEAITINQDDVDYYNRVLLNDGSNTAVVVGEEITQYQALQALLLPSSNNMAYTLAKWAFGSEEKYLIFANNLAKSLGMKNTNFDDASGFSSKTTSTAEDLTRLAVNAMDVPIIAEIAIQKEAVIPVAGRIFNVNRLLGRENIVGIKTGNTDQAGGCFMAASKKKIGDQEVIAVSVVLGSTHLGEALSDSLPLINSVLDGFKSKTAIKKGQKVANYNIPWGGVSEIVADSDVNVVYWPERPYEINTNIDKVISRSSKLPSGTSVGNVLVRSGRSYSESKAVITADINPPTTSQLVSTKLNIRNSGH